MMNRQKPYEVGSLVRVYPAHGGYPLPEGLLRGGHARVLKIETGCRDIEYRGHTFRVAMACIHSGWLPVIPQRS